MGTIDGITSPRYFLSYAGLDRPEIRALAAGLTTADLSLWCDILDGALPASTSWVRALEQALEQSDCYLLFVGHGPIEGWVRAELDLALRTAIARERAGKRFGIVPLVTPGLDMGKLGGFVGSFQGITLLEVPTRMGPDAFRDLAQRIGESFADTIPARNRNVDGPYPGLSPFEENRAAYFFGRDMEIRDGCERLGQGPRWLSIEGPSGAGKSSFVRAGLVPAARRGWFGSSAETRVPMAVALMRPGRAVITNLAEGLSKGLQKVKPDAPGVAAIEHQLRQSSAGIVHVLRDHLPIGLGMLLVVDQFEELFTVTEHSSDVAHFEALVIAMLDDTDRPRRLVTTLRSDFADELERVPTLRAALNDASRYQIGPLVGNALRSAIEEPALLDGLRYDPGLVDDILTEAAAATGGLPLVAHVVQILWERKDKDLLTREVYKTVGRVSGALEKSADAIVKGLGETGLAQARSILLRLVRTRTPRGPSRQTALRREVLEAAGGGDEAKRVLVQLSGGRAPTEEEGTAKVRLVTVTPSGDGADAADRVDLVHDALLTSWPRMEQWINDQRKALDCRDDVEAMATAWRTAGSPRDNLYDKLLEYFRGARDMRDDAKAFLLAAEEEQRRVKVFNEQQKAQTFQAYDLIIRVNQCLDTADGIAKARQLLAEGIGLFGAQSQQDTTENAMLLPHRTISRPELGSYQRENAPPMHKIRPISTTDVGQQDSQSVSENYDLSSSYEKLVDIAKPAEYRPSVSPLNEKALEFQITAADTNPKVNIREDSSTSYIMLGDNAKASGNVTMARMHYQKAYTLAKERAAKDPMTVDWQIDLAFCYHRLYEVAALSNNPEEARSHASRARSIIADVDRAGSGKSVTRLDQIRTILADIPD